MAENTNKKYSNEELNEFWNFVETIQFNQSKDAKTIMKDLLKRLVPHQSELYKNVCDDYAYFLNSKLAAKNTKYLFYCYAAIAAGREFYNLCSEKTDTLESLTDQVDLMNHLGNCFPLSDDYFFPDQDSFIVEESKDFEYEEYEEYDDNPYEDD